MKPVFIVTLNFHSRHAQPNIGDFKYSDKHKRHVWKAKEITEASEFAQSVNEALLFQRQMNFMELVVEVLEVPSVASEPEKAPEAMKEREVATPTPEFSPEAQKKKPGRPPSRIFTLEPSTP